MSSEDHFIAKIIVKKKQPPRLVEIFHFTNLKDRTAKVKTGSPWPIGSSLTQDGVNFSIAAPYASNIDLLIFESEHEDHPNQIVSLSEKNRSGDYWHVEIEGLHEGVLYGYKIFEGHKNNLDNDLILDPCSRAISGWNKYTRDQDKKLKNGYRHHLKGVVTKRDYFDFKSHPRPKHKWNQTIIYELHVGGFTKNPNSNVSGNKKGTFIGLTEKIPYLKSLGITTIELLPVFAFDIFDSPKGVENYWGYSPINWFTPHQDFVTGEDPLEARNQFRKLIEICHDNDLEVIIDVVYNHTTEGNKNGPVISWKGLGKTYYHQDENGNYQDVTGCGNSIAANRPLARKLILESLQCWAIELGVDGFRFDLGIALSRGENLTPLESPPLFEEIEADPILSELKLISEPWDCGGLYKLGDFPAQRFRTWNGHFRDDVRRFWKGEKNTTWALKDRLSGSQSLYKDSIFANNYTINFLTSHDGFTLNDLVSFNKKHNLANGENNRDGENHNNSWNHGIEGPTTDKQINNLRKRQQRNLFSSLLLSPGIPMLLMGDEIGRSQGGNNNAWCQNNQIGWMNWCTDNCDQDLKEFIRKLINIRKQLPEFFSPKFIYDSSCSETKLQKNDFWIQWHGVKLNKPDWSSWSHTLGYSINKKDEGSAIWIGCNAYEESMTFELPSPTSSWKKFIDTSSIKTKRISTKTLPNQCTIQLESHSLVLLVANEYSKKVRL